MIDQVYSAILSWEPFEGDKKYLLTASTIQELFQNNRLLMIPDYQRPYSWTEKNIKDLLDDIDNLTQRLSDDSYSSSWFFGPIFIVKRSTNERKVDLLDGQQRITTIQILLRELGLILVRKAPIDFEGYAGLEKKLNEAIKLCSSCLTRNEGMEKVVKFQTEDSVRQFYEDYILEFEDIKVEDYERVQDIRQKLSLEADRMRKTGSKTASNIFNCSVQVNKYLENKFFPKGDINFGKLELLYDFIETLLTKCWLLEIPLQNHNDSIQIFESINNRGKSLTLVDKLKYKTLIKVDESDLQFVRSKWKVLYSKLDFLLEKKFIKEEDDFFKVFFNSINGSNNTKEEQHLEEFEKEFLSSTSKIKDFMQESIKVAEFYYFMYNALDQDNMFVETFERDKDKAKSLLRLLDKTLKISANSRLLLFHALRKNLEYLETMNYSLIISLWNIIRIVILTEIVEVNKSNQVRTNYLSLIKSYNKGEKKLKDASDIRKYHLKMFNLIRNNDNNECQLILYLYTYLNNFKTLSQFTKPRYDQAELDHLFPIAWKRYWSDKSYKKEQVITYINELSTTKPDLFEESIQAENLIRVIENFESEDFELKDYSTSAPRGKDSLLEFIGNKWVLSGSKNAGSSNYVFLKKVDHYKDSNFLKIPRNEEVKVGFGQYIEQKDFTFKDIIERSLAISKGISIKFKNNWDDI